MMSEADSVGSTVSRRAAVRLALAVAGLCGGHLAVAWLWPTFTGTACNPVLHLAWLVADLFAASSFLLIHPTLQPAGLAAFAAGYAAVVCLLWPLIFIMQENLLLLV